MTTDREEFGGFFAEAEPRLRRALIALYGSDRGREAAAEALAYGFEHWEKIRKLDNPTGYLFRVGQSRTRLRRQRTPYMPHVADDPWCEPGLGPALARLSKGQRTAVVLVHGFGWTLREVGELTGTRVTTVQNHVERGLARLRALLEVNEHAGSR